MKTSGGGGIPAREGSADAKKDRPIKKQTVAPKCHEIRTFVTSIDNGKDNDSDEYSSVLSIHAQFVVRPDWLCLARRMQFE